MTHGLIEWDPPLRHRHGGDTFLDGIDVYYDFNWWRVCGHGRSQFRNGQSLARLARANCPEGKTPALLLTARDDVPERPITTETHFFLVVNLPRYLAQATGNAAVSYYADQLQAGIVRLAELEELASRPDVIDTVFSAERLAEWASDPEHRQRLRDALGTHETPSADLAQLLSAISALEGIRLDDEAIATIASLFGPGTDREQRWTLLRAVTADSDGRHVTGEVLTERIPERLGDARRAVEDYEALLAGPRTTETDMQSFIESNLWLLGLDYGEMRSGQPVLLGETDFLLDRHDGFYDLLELKSPQDPIIRVQSSGDAAPPPSAFSLSPALAQALAQVHVYRDRLTRHAEATYDLLGLPYSRDPRLIIVIGRADALPDPARRVLTELNKSLHRVEVVPYDVLGRRASAVLDNIERYRLAARGQPPDAPS
jgi:hypothetical protein